MKPDSLKNRIVNFFFKHPDWINGGEIERLAMTAGYKGSTAARLLRRLVEDGKLVSEIRKGTRISSAWYKLNV